MSAAATDIGYRPAIEADHAAIIDVADEWAGGRRVRETLPHLWLRHFASTSLIAETPDGRLAGFLVGLVSPDRPTDGVIAALGVRPGLRRRGIGRSLVKRFATAAAEDGATRAEIVVWPGDPVVVAFLRAIGFIADAGPGTQNRYGTPAYPDLDGEREDRAIFWLPIAPTGR